MSLETENHEVTVLRELDDGTEVKIACIVQVSVDGPRRVPRDSIVVEFEACGELPDGTMTDLDAGEIVQLEDLADDIRRAVVAKLEDAALERAGE